MLFKRILNSKPPAYFPSLFANLLGAHLVYLCIYKILYMCKGKRKIDVDFQDHLNVLEKDGVAIIPDFLSESDHKYVCEQYKKMESRFKEAVPYSNSSVLFPHVEQLSLDSEVMPQKARSFFIEHPLITSIASGFLRRRKLVTPAAYFRRVFVNTEEEVGSPQNGGTNNIHTDAPVPVLKFFYFIDDASVKNGTLHYARGSHKHNTLHRLWLEYCWSVRYAWNKRRVDLRGEYDMGKPWVRISEEEVKSLGFSLEPIEAKANMLAIVNVGGIHKRGSFMAPGERKTIEINFRNADIPKNYLESLWS